MMKVTDDVLCNNYMYDLLLLLQLFFSAVWNKHVVDETL